MPPTVIIHSAISMDGKLRGFEADLGAFYGLIVTWKEDATLCGADTILAATSSFPPTDESAPPKPGDEGLPWLLITDSRGRINCWNALRSCGYWREGVALVTKSTPRSYLAYLERIKLPYIMAGSDRVDLVQALSEFCDKYEAVVIRADCGPNLNTALLISGLVKEVSLLVHPVCVGSDVQLGLIEGQLDKSQTSFSLLSVEKLDPDLVWLRYKVENAEE